MENVLLAFDGSAPSARSLKAFVHLLPYGKDLEINLVYVADGESSEEMDKALTILKQAENYLKEHNFRYISKEVLEKGEPGERLIQLQTQKNPDLTILGAHSVSAVRRAAFGSTTHHLITKSEVPLFLSP